MTKKTKDARKFKEKWKAAPSQQPDAVNKRLNSMRDRRREALLSLGIPNGSESTLAHRATEAAEKGEAVLEEFLAGLLGEYRRNQKKKK